MERIPTWKKEGTLTRSSEGRSGSPWVHGRVFSDVMTKFWRTFGNPVSYLRQ